MKKILFHMMTACLLGGLFPVTAQPVSSNVMKYLKSHSFQQLIQQYGNRAVQLTVPSQEVRKQQALPYRLAPGYRVQVMASTQKERVMPIFRQIRDLQLDSTYMVYADGLYKIQVGNYQSKDQARQMLDKLYYAGFKDAWIVSTTIHLPKPSLQTVSGDTFFYAIQVYATHSPDRAEMLQDSLQKRIDLPVWTFQWDQIWKVLIGKFTDEAEARRALQGIRQQGWPDAWVTQVFPD